MSESYTVGGDTLQNLGGNFYACQTFTPLTSHTLNFIGINLRTVHKTRVPSVWVYLADAEHKPTGAELSHSRRCYADNWNLYNVFRMQADMSPTLLTAGTEYCIFIHAFALDAPQHMRWQYDKGDANYPRGIRLISTDGGATWAARPDDDHIFVEWGSAPLPPPPPSPPTTKWLLVSLEQTLTATGYRLTVTTNVPCHLWMRWTTIEPKEHMIPIERRGLFLHADKYYCFDAYEDNEQEQAGDTITHTFIKEPWAHCETRWFYFHGTIDGIPSPSTSPTFKKHRIQPALTVTFYPDAHPEVTSCDGIATRHLFNQSWAQLRDGAGTGGDALSSYGGVHLISHDVLDKWRYLLRSYLLFDTSPLPPSATILEATLRIYGDLKLVAAGWEAFDICVVNTATLSNTDILLHDYQNIGSTLLSNTLISTASWNDAGWNEFPLNPLGLSSISKTGITKLALRNNCWDRLNVGPPWLDKEQVLLRFMESDNIAGFKPELVVSYQP